MKSDWSWGSVENAFSNAWHDVTQTVSNGVNDLKQQASNVGNDIVHAATTVGNDIENAASTTWIDIKNTESTIVNDAGSAFSAAVTWGKNAITQTEQDFNTAVNAAKAWIDEQVANIEAIAQEVFSGIGHVIIEIYDALIDAKNAIVKFFQSGGFNTIKQFLYCVTSSGLAGVQIYNTFNGFYTKYDTFIASASAGPIGEGADATELLIGLICNWQKFTKAIDYLVNAQTTTGDQQYMWWGEFAGMLMNAIGTSKKKMKRFKK
jgi:hypothetical protein